MSSGDVPASTWRAPDPARLPELRADLLAHTLSDHCALQLATVIDMGKYTMLPVPGEHGTLDDLSLQLSGYGLGARAAPLLTRMEAARLSSARLYHVSRDMTELARAAARTPPAETVRARRLPSPAGLMVFDGPIGGYTQDMAAGLRGSPLIEPLVDRLMVYRSIVAVSWAHWHTGAVQIDGGGPVGWLFKGPGGVRRVPRDRQGVWLTFYSDGADWRPLIDRWGADLAVGRSRRDGRVFTLGDLAAPDLRKSPLVWDNEVMLGWGSRFSPDPPQGTPQPYAQVVYTTWQLITQGQGSRPITRLQEVPRNRGGCKRDARQGIADEGTVRLVNVHAPPSRGQGQQAFAQGGGRRYTCRWPVPPYRRDTCLDPRRHKAGECEHEERIVAFSIRGPAGAPLRAGGRVNVLDHLPQD